MDIEGLGPSIIDQLVDSNMVADIAGLYSLTAEELAGLERMGEKSASNLVDALRASKKRGLERLLFGLGIRFVGVTVAEQIARYYRSIDPLMRATREELEGLEGIGPRVADSVVFFFSQEENREVIRCLVEAGVSTRAAEPPLLPAGVFSGKSFVLSGTLENYTRDEASGLIKRLGGRVVSSVSKKVDYLLCGKDAGSKLEKAKKLGIEILSEEDFEKKLILE
jgi:DNA ligase (NAD+)